jgi:DnaK suppressor protein
LATRSRKKARAKSNNNTNALREMLMEQREEILNLYEHDLRVGQEAGNDGAEDIVDRANNAYNREFMFSLSDNERQVLLQIEGALERLEGGTYGTCGHCGEEIPKARLKAVPWAGYCVDCQEQSELGDLNEA